MPDEVAIALAAACALAALAWLGILLDPLRAWQLRPVADDEHPAPAPSRWPSVRVIIPAQNEVEVLQETLPTILGQTYEGEWSVVVVDERSTDATSALARAHAASPESRGRLAVVSGRPLPAGWVGKVWGLEQGSSFADQTEPDYYLLTDADIAHVATSLRNLVSDSENRQLSLNSRMARLHCESSAEKALIPAFVFFFNLLYPMRRVNDPDRPAAAAAGGCILLRSDALRAIGGFERIRTEIIDDVNIARAVQKADPRLRLAVSRSDVRSVRRYNSIGPIWRMVRRTAFDELEYSWPRLTAASVSMLLLFPLPLCGLALSAGLGGAAAAGIVNSPGWQLAVIAACSLAALTLMRIAYGPAVRLFELRNFWAWALPFAGVVYGLATLDSARRHLAGRSGQW